MINKHQVTRYTGHYRNLLPVVQSGSDSGIKAAQTGNSLNHSVEAEQKYPAERKYVNSI